MFALISHSEILARVSCCWGKTSARGKCLLRGLCAGQATRLAPAKKTVGFAILGAVFASRCVALSASLGNANGSREAIVEFVVIELAGENVVR